MPAMFRGIGKRSEERRNDAATHIEESRRQEARAAAAGIRATALALRPGRASFDSGKTWLDKGDVVFTDTKSGLRVEAPDGASIESYLSELVSRHIVDAEGRGLDGDREALQAITRAVGEELGVPVSPCDPDSRRVGLSGADWLACLVALHPGDVFIDYPPKAEGDDVVVPDGSDGDDAAEPAKPDSGRQGNDGTLIVVKTAVGDKSSADLIAAEAVRRGLAASAQATRMESTFVWDGVLKRIEEWEIRLLSVDDKFDELVRTIDELHPYELGGITCMRATATPQFAEWVGDCVGQPLGDDIEDTLPDGDDGR